MNDPQTPNDALRRAGNGPEAPGPFGTVEPAFEGEAFEELQELVREQEARLRRFMIAHPTTVLLGALAAGFVLARLFRGEDS